MSAANAFRAGRGLDGQTAPVPSGVWKNLPHAQQSIMHTSLATGVILAAANSRAELSLNHAGLLPDALARIRGASRLKPGQLCAVLVQMDKLVRMGDLLPVLLAAAAVHAPLASKVATASP